MKKWLKLDRVPSGKLSSSTVYNNRFYYLYFMFREVFKARDKNNPKKFVAMKKVLMENEKEGVSVSC